MKDLLAGLLWFFVAAWWFLAEAWLAALLGPWRIDLGAAFCVFAIFSARPAALPWLLACAGIGRTLALGGSAAVHVLLLGLPVLVLFPLRRFGRVPLRAVAAGAVAVALPMLPQLLPRVGAQAPAPLPVPALGTLAWTMVVAPIAAGLLGRLPPLWFFREPAR